MSDYLNRKLSDRNRYKLSEARTRELRWFVMQYPEWRRGYALMENESYLPPVKIERSIRFTGDTFLVESKAIQKASLSMRIQMVDDAAQEADRILAPYILEGVIKNISYDALRALKPDIPCCRDTYYATVRKFFWVLDKKRD